MEGSTAGPDGLDDPEAEKSEFPPEAALVIGRHWLRLFPRLTHGQAGFEEVLESLRDLGCPLSRDELVKLAEDVG